MMKLVIKVLGEDVGENARDFILNPDAIIEDVYLKI